MPRSSRQSDPPNHRKETRQTEEKVGRQHQGMDRPGVCQVPEGSGEQGKMEETGCEIIYGASSTSWLRVMMMMILFSLSHTKTMLPNDQHFTPRVDQNKASHASAPAEKSALLL